MRKSDREANVLEGTVKGIMKEEKGERLCGGEGYREFCRWEKFIKHYRLHLQGEKMAFKGLVHPIPMEFLEEGNTRVQHHSAVAWK